MYIYTVLYTHMIYNINYISHKMETFNGSCLQSAARPGPTFTFCFWGVSRFCDVMTWQALGGLEVGSLE